MPRPPKPLCLPDLISNPRARAEYIESHPPVHGPTSPRPSSSSQHDESSYQHVPPSPTSTNDANSHRASGATSASLNSPVTPASTRTSLSVHNAPWTNDASKRNSGFEGGLLPTPGSGGEGKSWGIHLGLGGAEPASKKPRASWSSAFSNTKSWFGVPPPTEAKEASSSTQRHSSQKEIKLSPSMIAASTSTPSISNRPVSSPYPPAIDPPLLSPTGSAPDTSASRPPRVGSGLRYYTERNPAPTQTRVQIPDPIDPQDHDRPPPPTHPHHDPIPNPSTPTLTTFAGPMKQLPAVPDVTVRAMSPPSLDLAALKDAGMGRAENKGPLSPPPTPPVHERDSNVPHIRVSSGEDL